MDGGETPADVVVLPQRRLRTQIDYWGAMRREKGVGGVGQLGSFSL
jgi:hypothetical protein